MIYDNSTIRRQDRLLDETAAMELLHGGEYGFMSLADHGNPYVVPMSYAVKGDRIYFHCAPEGVKLRLIEKNDLACFCIVGETKVQPDKFTTLYESVMAFGRIAFVEYNNECMTALELLLDKYSPNDKTAGLKYAANSLTRTRVLCMTIERISGKTKSLKP